MHFCVLHDTCEVLIKTGVYVCPYCEVAKGNGRVVEQGSRLVWRTTL